MYSLRFGIHGMISAFVAFAILGITALVLDRGYLYSAPAGVIEVAQPVPVEALDEVVVTARNQAAPNERLVSR